MPSEIGAPFTTASERITSVAVHGSSVAAGLEEQLRFMSEEGIPFLELGRLNETDCTDMTREQLQFIGRSCEAAGVSIFAVRTSIGLSADPSEKDRERMVRCMRNASTLGARYVLLQSYWRKITGGVRDRFSLICEHFRRMLVSSHSSDIIVCVRNLAGTTCETSLDLIRLVDAVGSQQLRAVFDPANASLVGEVAYSDGFPLLAPYLAYIHGRDFDPGAGIFVPPGEGVCQWTKIMTHLKQHGLAGPLTLDFSMSQVGNEVGASSLSRACVGTQAMRGLIKKHLLGE